MPYEKVAKRCAMITEDEKNVILRYAREYNVSSVILFGSSIEDEGGANDIDLGVKGIEQRLFFKFYAELIKNLSKSVDLIDLSLKSKFSDIVEETGVRIYG